MRKARHEYAPGWPRTGKSAVSRGVLEALILRRQFACRQCLSVRLRLSVARKHPPGALRAEWQCKAVRERHVRWRRVCGHADRNRVLRYVEAQRAMKVIPHGQTAGPVRVRFLGDDGMVNAVQTRRDDEMSHDSLDADGQFDIRVMKQDREQEDVLPYPEGVERDPDGGNLHRAPWDRERELAGVEPHCDGTADTEIYIFIQMDPPQPRHAV